MWQNNNDWWVWWRLYRKFFIIYLHLFCKIENVSNKKFTKKDRIVHMHILRDLLDFIPSILLKFISFVCVFPFSFSICLLFWSTCYSIPVYLGYFEVSVCFPSPLVDIFYFSMVVILQGLLDDWWKQEIPYLFHLRPFSPALREK